MSQCRRMIFVCCCLALGSSGCGGVRTDYSKVELANVQGTMRLDGQPLVGALVIYEAPDRTFSYAETDESGSYRLMFNSEKAGVTPGPKIVRVRTRGGFGDEESTMEGEQTKGAEPETIPPCYHAKSQLKVTVAEGSQYFEFDLRSDCSTTSPVP